MRFIKRYINGASLVSLSLLIPKILPFFTKWDGITDGWMDGWTDDPYAICPRIFQIIKSRLILQKISTTQSAVT